MMAKRESGLTVIELLISMSILLLIMSPLATAFVVGLGTTRASEQDAGNSADAQLLASFWDIDVASAQSVSTNTGCGGSTTVLELVLINSGVTTYVAYYTELDPTRKARLQLATDVYDLVRATCSSPTGPATDPQVIARTLQLPPTVACDGQSACTEPKPRRVALTAKAYSTQISDVATPGFFSFSVTASRRVRP